MERGARVCHVAGDDLPAASGQAGNPRLGRKFSRRLHVRFHQNAANRGGGTRRLARRREHTILAAPALAPSIATGKTNVRIVMLVHNTIGRGTFNRAHSLGRHLVARGHEVTLLAGASAYARPVRRNLNGVEVIEAFDPLPRRARESGLSPFDLAGRISYFLRNDRFDLIHSFDHRPTVSVPALLFSRRRQTPCVIDWADLWGFEGIASQRRPMSRALLGSLDQFLEDRVRRRASALTVINTKLRERAQQRFQVPILLLPVGANTDLIQPLPKKEMRRRFGFPENAAIALHAGLSPYDSEYLARSFLELVRLHPGAILAIAGSLFSVFSRYRSR